ncbi:hypothetical protein ACFCX4_20260 [Kitasatospora sp. NPDC056327]|uniref:hypothetical protein n=1 Tax=Kitasatospora sp. NPDC056327 TaxID=3345785 RepID=UPI0035E03369
MAADLVGLARLAARQDRREDAAALLAGATELAGAAGAHGILRQVTGARNELALP